MKITTSQKDQITIIDVEGEVDTNTAPELQDKLVPMVQPNSKILLDMKGVTYMSSAGLRFVLTLYRRANAQGARIVLATVSPEIQETMEMVGFMKFFTLSADRQAGLTALA
jgi:anti-sigma B factor antagonist